MHSSVTALIFMALATSAFAQPTGEPARRAFTQLFSCPLLSVDDYPAAALRVEAQGETAVELSVDGETRTVAAKVVKSSGETREHKLLNRVALKKFSECRYVGPIPTSAFTERITYKFSLGPVR